MTDEERQKLIIALRQLADPTKWPGYPIPSTCAEAADEIERLAADKRRALDVCQRLLAEKGNWELWTNPTLPSCGRWGGRKDD
jgi:hypothetical protein